MSRKKYENLAQVKQALADKYERLAAVTPSKPRKKSMKHHAERHRRQAEVARRLAEQG